MRAALPPLWEQHPDEPLWWTVLAEHRTIYVSMRAVAPGPQSNTDRAQWDRVFALVDSVPDARLVIDIREDLGGNGGLNRYPVQQVLRRPGLDRPDRLFVIIGRRCCPTAASRSRSRRSFTRRRTHSTSAPSCRP